MTRKIIPLALVFFLPLIIWGQDKAPNCARVKKGIFYFYPTGADKSYKIERNDSVQEEIDLQESDTSFYKVDWKNDCEFGLIFIKDSKPLTDEKRDFMATHTVYCNVLKVTKGYYIFKGRMDPDPGLDMPADTIWVKKRL